MDCKEWITLNAVNTAPVCSTHTFNNANRCLIYAPRNACPKAHYVVFPWPCLCLPISPCCRKGAEGIPLPGLRLLPTSTARGGHGGFPGSLWGGRGCGCTPRHGPTAGPWGLGWPHHGLRLAPLSPSAPARQPESRRLYYNSLWNLLCYVISPLLYYGGKKNKLLRMLVSNCNNFPWTG